VHVWTAPGAQEALRDLADGTSAIMCPACDAVRGGPLAQMGFAEQAPNTDAAWSCLCTTRGVPFVGSTGCHLLPLPFCSSAMTSG
jgi:hypothetical protein